LGWVYFTNSHSSKASSITAAHLEEQDLLLPELDSHNLLNDSLSLLDQVDGACDSKPFQSTSCFGKKPELSHHHGENSSSGSFSEDSDADGPIRMISAKPTYATEATVDSSLQNAAEPSPVKNETEEGAPVSTSPVSSFTLKFGPATLQSASNTIDLEGAHHRRGSGFPFEAPARDLTSETDQAAEFSEQKPETESTSSESSKASGQNKDRDSNIDDDSSLGPDEPGVSRFQTALEE
jgi:hypothetical protein